MNEKNGKFPLLVQEFLNSLVYPDKKTFNHLNYQKIHTIIETLENNKHF